jgi:hypothetical protein
MSIFDLRSNYHFSLFFTPHPRDLTYLAIQNVVGNLSTSKETLLTEDRVDTDVGLKKKKKQND